jgi:hypothetical protein
MSVNHGFGVKGQGGSADGIGDAATTFDGVAEDQRQVAELELPEPLGLHLLHQEGDDIRHGLD